MKKLHVYVDASVIGGCEDVEFADASLSLWRFFIKGEFIQVLSEHTLRELQKAPESIRARLHGLEKKYDAQFKVAFEAIRQLMTKPEPPRGQIGFHVREKYFFYRARTKKRG